MAETYVDEGKSARGDPASKHTEFKRMVEDVQGGLLEVVEVYKLDRFARNIRVTFAYLEPLARHSVRFLAVPRPELAGLFALDYAARTQMSRSYGTSGHDGGGDSG